MTAFDKLIGIYITQDEIAKAFKVTRQAVGYWKRDGIPLKRAKQVEKLTKGKITITDVIG